MFLSVSGIQTSKLCVKIIVKEVVSIHAMSRPQDKSAYLKIIFLIFTPNICCGNSKEPSQ